MPNAPSLPPKPRSEVLKPEITRLPPLTAWRRAFRWGITRLLRLLVFVCLRIKLTGMENFPYHQAFLLVTNHLGSADLVVGAALAPVPVEVVSKAELRDYPFLGWLMRAYGVIWVHRGQPDRRALRAVLAGLAQGRIVGVAPEARESLTGALEEGTEGAAYLALKAGVPLLPVTFTGTENEIIYPNLKRMKRSQVTVTIGPLFNLDPDPNWQKAVQRGTEKIMLTLSGQLPEKYRGVYAAQISIGEDGPKYGNE